MEQYKPASGHTQIHDWVHLQTPAAASPGGRAFTQALDGDVGQGKKLKMGEKPVLVF